MAGTQIAVWDIGAISGLTSVGTPASADEFIVLQSGSFKRMTLAQILSGNATTATLAAAATILANTRTINGTGFNGSANITVTAAAGTLTGTVLKSTVVTSSLTKVGVQDQDLDMGTKIVKNAGAYVKVVATLADEADPTVLDGELFKAYGTTTISDFDDGVVGQTIQILAVDTITITNGTPILLLGAADYVMTVKDTLTLTMFDDQVWQEVSRSVN